MPREQQTWPRAANLAAMPKSQVRAWRSTDTVAPRIVCHKAPNKFAAANLYEELPMGSSQGSDLVQACLLRADVSNLQLRNLMDFWGATPSHERMSAVCQLSRN